jgi:acyl carrier protein
MQSEVTSRLEIKRVIIESLGLEGLTPEMIEDDAPLFGEQGLGLDSVDALELLVVFEKQFGISIETEGIDPEAFATVAKLEEFVMGLKTAQG